jgi:hypothetical protein
MTYRNFSISKGKGKLYLKEKVPTDGYEEVTYGEGKKTYHQYHDKVEGIPKEFGVREITYEGRTLKFLELSLEDGDTVNKVSMNVRNKGGYTDESKALLSAMRGLDTGERVSLAAVRSESVGKNGKTYENLNIYINYLDREKTDDNKSPTTGYIHFNDVPKPTQKEVAGETVWDFTPQTEFYYAVQKEVEHKFDSPAETTKPEPVKATQPLTKATAVAEKAKEEKEEDDKLPF